MASITIRNLDDDVKQALKMRAVENGRSMEEQARLTLAEAALARKPARMNLAAEFAKRFDPLGGIEINTYDLAVSNPFLVDFLDDQANET